MKTIENTLKYIEVQVISGKEGRKVRGWVVQQRPLQTEQVFDPVVSSRWCRADPFLSSQACLGFIFAACLHFESQFDSLLCSIKTFVCILVVDHWISVT